VSNQHKYTNKGFKVARLSLWKDGRHTNDYKFFDRRISEMFTIGGTGILCHKYLGPVTQGLQVAVTAPVTTITNVLTVSDTSNINLGDTVTCSNVPANTTVIAKDAGTITLSADVTGNIDVGTSVGVSSSAALPSYTNQSEQNIQDLLWLENRDRKYDTSVYKMRGIYQRQDQDFDLSQFGLFLATGTIFMTFHLRDMVDLIGRKLMNGDVLELEHLTDYDALNQDVPAALKRYYVVGDASFASEGFTPTWWPHLWRVKLNPLVDSQEYKDILNNITVGSNNTPVGQLLSTLNINLGVNDATIKEAEANVPLSGYDTSSIYVEPETIPEQPDRTADENLTADDVKDTADEGLLTPGSVPYAYLGGNGTAPNGIPMGMGIQFPQNPLSGDYFLRTDYLPNRVFRFDGKRWVTVNDVQRTGLTPGATNQTLLGTFVNASGTFVNNDGNTVNVKQSLSKALKPKADN
jgi:hypothetical protein